MAFLCRNVELINDIQVATDCVPFSTKLFDLTLADIQLIAPYIILLFIVIGCFKALFKLPKMFTK